MIWVLDLPHHPGTVAAMAHPTPLLLLLAIPHGSRPAGDAPEPTVPTVGPDLDAAIADFHTQPLTPAAALAFERRLETVLRDYGRRVAEAVSNAAAARTDATTGRVRFDGEDYRRLGTATRNPHVATLFGPITRTRHLYRCCRRDAGEPCLAPAETALGLSHGATPALAEAATRYLAEAGATQAAVRARLKDRHGVALGVKRLPALAADRAAAIAAGQTERLADRVIDLLGQADTSRGRHKPVLSVGRDGVTLRDYRHRFFETAGVATPAVLDRRGRRLGTAYVGGVPEPKQTTLSQRLTAVLEAVLRRWDGPLPRLCYVTDAGDHETAYDRDVLRRMRHPRTRVRLTWQRVVDFYHAMERAWAMAERVRGRRAGERGVGAADGEGVEEAKRPVPGVARRRRPAGPANDVEGATSRVFAGVPGHPTAKPLDAVRHLRPAPIAAGKWGDRSGLQDTGGAAAEAVGDAVDDGGCPGDPGPAGGPVERDVGRGESGRPRSPAATPTATSRPGPSRDRRNGRVMGAWRGLHPVTSY